MVERVAWFLRVLSGGSSFPSVVTSTSGRRYVLKLSGAGSGGRGLATEYLALKLAKTAGVNVPEAEVIDVEPSLPWQVGTDEFYETVQRSAGPNLGIAFIPDAHDLDPVALVELPQDFMTRLAAIDALLQNVDRRAKNANIVRDAHGTAWAIDFGACLLFERLARGATEMRLDLPPGHFLAGRTTGPSVREVAEAIEPRAMEAAVAGVPGAWLEDLGVEAQVLAGRLAAYLERARS